MMDSVVQFFNKIGLSNTVLGSVILLLIARLIPRRKLKKDKLKIEAETAKLKTEVFITKERFRKEELEEALTEAQSLKEENKILKKQLEDSNEKIDKLIRKINVLETFYNLKNIN